MSDYIEQINQLLDGELDQMHESQLYGELAVNADLRAEMREQLAVKTAVQEDRAALIPPLPLTSQIFSGLGFAAPLAGAAAGAAGGSLLLQWLTRLGIPILSAIAAVGLSIGITSESGERSTESAQQSQDSEQQVAITGEQREESGEQRADGGGQTTVINAELIAQLRAENAELRQQLSNRPVVTREVPRDVVRTVSDGRSERLAAELADALAENDQLRKDLAAKDATVAQATTPAQRESIADIPVSTIKVDNAIDLRMSGNEKVITQRPMGIEWQPTAYPHYSLQLRGFALTPTVNTFYNPQTEWYSNFGASIGYSPNRHSMFGIEFANEAYPQVFDADENGQVVQYQQYPATFWTGIYYRHIFNQIGSLPLAPFAQGLVGGSEFGPIGRATLGLQYSPAGPLTFLLGFEASALTYSYQSTFYVSPKYGLTYGLAIRF